MGKMKLIGYTCTFNEAEMVPYVMPYIESLGYDKFIVYDNMSTDNTVELLSKYPFVEIRTYNTGGRFDDNAKRNLEINAYVECRYMAKVGTKEETLVWMTFTDFDEVLYCSTDVGGLYVYLSDYYFDGYNCFFEQMVNVLPPKGYNGSITELLKKENKILVHTLDGAMGNWWTGRGNKPLLFCVNAFSYMAFVPGNHYAVCRLEEGQEIKNLGEKGDISAFHLKFIDKENLKRRYQYYSDRGMTCYTKQLPEIDVHYRDALYAASFPMENYFLIKGFKNNSYNLDKGCGLKLAI